MDRALAVLKRGPTSAGIVGSRLWPDRKTRGTAVQGGGDYAAQMLLGQMRRNGLVRVQHGDGSSIWELTECGGRVLEIKNEIAHVRDMIRRTPPGPFGDGGLSHRIDQLKTEMRELIERNRS